MMHIHLETMIIVEYAHLVAATIIYSVCNVHLLRNIISIIIIDDVGGRVIYIAETITESVHVPNRAFHSQKLSIFTRQYWRRKLILSKITVS